MNNLIFFAETYSGKIVQFWNLSFVLEGKLCVWTDKAIMKGLIDKFNRYPEKHTGNLFIRTKETLAFSKNTKGYISTSHQGPTKDDISLLDFRTIWIES